MSTQTATREASDFSQNNGGLPPTIPDVDSVDVPAEIALARQAQRAWWVRPLSERIAIIRRFRHSLPAHARELAAPIHPQRRSLAESLGAEVMPLADACKFVERIAPAVLKPVRLGWRFRPVWLYGVRSEIRREPFGVVLIIGPANYPLFLTASQALQGLVAGNAVIVKPGAGGGESMRIFAQLLVDAGLDPRLVRVLPETPKAAQQAIATGVDKVLLTGSAKTGANVLSQLAPRLIPAAVELSGCDAVFVRPEADLDLVTRALGFGLRLNQSETCIAPRRVFVDRSRAPELKQRLTALGAELQNQIMTTPAAKIAAVRVRDALNHGAELVAGRILPDNQGLSPTVLANTSPELAIMREDTFAPVMSVVEVADVEDALRLAAQCPYGLGASIFGDSARALDLAQHVRSGSITINDVIAPTADPRLPFGGRGHSGFGVTRGAEGLLELTTVKVISVRHGNLNWHLDGPDPADGPLFEAYLKAAHSPHWTTRLAGWFSFFRLMIRKMRTATKAE
jgi:acyl-CoA reductase-like NAD-dependent aldehyde dehydrogenase